MLLMAPALVISQNGELYLHTLFLFPEVVEMELEHWRENISYHHNELWTTLYFKTQPRYKGFLLRK